jgi:hypothetical protein
VSKGRRASEWLHAAGWRRRRQDSWRGIAVCVDVRCSQSHFLPFEIMILSRLHAVHQRMKGTPCGQLCARSLGAFAGGGGAGGSAGGGAGGSIAAGGSEDVEAAELWLILRRFSAMSCSGSGSGSFTRVVSAVPKCSSAVQSSGDGSHRDGAAPPVKPSGGGSSSGGVVQTTISSAAQTSSLGATVPSSRPEQPQPMASQSGSPS